MALRSATNCTAFWVLAKSAGQELLRMVERDANPMPLLAGAIAEELRELGTPERAAAEKAYLRSALVHYGTSVPDMRRVVKRALRAMPSITHDQLIELCSVLWAGGVHEHRMAAVESLIGSARLLSPADLPWIESLLRDANTWALVDELARKVVGGLALVHADVTEILDRWVTDANFWIRRSAVLSLSPLLRADRELDRFFRYADLLLDETEFFIRKAIGWVAREVGQRNPARVSAWLRPNLARMNGVTIREAVKYLPDGDEILEAWKKRGIRPTPIVP
jgi:3-methyladenine DNA glycosylase AlkD